MGACNQKQETRCAADRTYSYRRLLLCATFLLCKVFVRISELSVTIKRAPTCKACFRRMHHQAISDEASVPKDLELGVLALTALDRAGQESLSLGSFSILRNSLLSIADPCCAGLSRKWRVTQPNTLPRTLQLVISSQKHCRIVAP